MIPEDDALRLFATGKKPLQVSRILGVSFTEMASFAAAHESTIMEMRAFKEINIAMQDKDIRQALAICSRKEYAYNININYKKASILFSQKDYYHALEICNNPIFVANIKFIILKIKILIKLANIESDDKQKQRMYAEICPICDNPIYADNEDIQVQRILLAKLMKDYKKGLDLCNNPIFSDNVHVQELKIDFLVLLNRWKEALRVCNLNIPLRRNNFLMKKIEVLEKMGRISEAFAICDEPDIINDSAFQGKKISILIKLGRYDEAINLSNREDLKNNETIINQRLYAEYQKKKRKIHHVNRIRTQEKPVASSINRIQIGTVEKDLLDKIIGNSATIEDINTSGLAPWKVITLTIAYYEASNHNSKLAISYLKEQIVAFNDNAEVLEILNKLKNRVIQKTKFFDRRFYERLLSTQIADREIQLIRNVDNK